MARTGRAAILSGEKGTFTVGEAVVPDPGPGEVLVRQSMCGVCGTDVHVYQRSRAAQGVSARAGP